MRGYQGTIETVYTLLDGEYEFIEAEILETSELIAKSIKDSNLPKEIRIGAVVSIGQMAWALAINISSFSSVPFMFHLFSEVDPTATVPSTWGMI